MVSNIQTKIDLYDLVAEDAVIGILLYEPELIAEVDLTPDCFSEYHRSKAFELIQGQPDDNILITLGEHLEGFDLSRLIDLFMDVANRDIHESELLTFAERVRAAKDLRLAGGPKPLNTAFMARYAGLKEGDPVTGGNLAGELWQDPVMVAPGVDHFKGEYPAEPEHKTCYTYWDMPIYEGEQGHVFKARGERRRVLRSFIGKGGIVAACPHCLHKRTIELCNQIERASESYTDQNLMRHVTVTDTKARRIAATVKKRNQRNKAEGITYSVVKVPQNNGQVWILHDVPDIEGQSLPVDRGSLFKMVYQAIRHTPKGRRGWRGLSKWGQAETESPKGEGQKQKAKQDNLKLVARLRGENWGKFSVLLQGFLGEDDPITRKGITFEADLTDMLQFLDDAGLNYAVIEGKLPDVPLKAYKQSKICVKRDNTPHQLEFKEDSIPF